MNFSATPVRLKIALVLVPSLLGALLLGGWLIQQLNNDARVAQQEFDGLAPRNQIMQAIRLTQIHRGLTAAWLAGNAQAGDERAQRAAEVEKAWAAVPATLSGAGMPESTQAQWTQLAGRWHSLAQAVASRTLDAAAATRAHTELIQDALAVVDQILYDSGLILDPSGDSYSLVTVIGQVLPSSIERMGQLRARGAGILAKGHGDPEDLIAAAALMGQIKDAKRQTQSAVRHAISFNDALAHDLDGPTQTALESTDRLLNTAQSQLFNADQRNLDSSAYFKAQTAEIETQYKYLDTVSGILENILSTRVHDAHRQATLAAVIVLLLAGVSLWSATRLASRILSDLGQALRSAQDMANGQLDRPIQARGGDEFGQLLRSMHDMQQKLAAVVARVRQSAESVASGSAQIAGANNDLSARTETQASALQQTSAAMNALDTTVRHNDAHAREANDLANSASEVAQRGGQEVARVVSTMRDIHQSSRKIEEIISVIDGIAFQTNILALNAAVEAARAGEQGRGFAVVAGEVRQLAGRSAEAAREIKSLITASVERIEQGTQLVDQAGTTMDSVVTSIGRVTHIMAEISTESEHQARGVREIGLAIRQLDESTQQNAALVEEMAAAAANLNSMAQHLVQSVGVFQLP